MASTKLEQPQISAADRIRELSAISNEVSAMLMSAGTAIDALANRQSDASASPQDSSSADGEDSSLSPNQKAFARHTQAYFVALQAICARLNRQAYALEEAGIVAPDASILTLSTSGKTTAGGVPGAAPGNTEGERIRNGGLGNFDVGWLNSRGNKVGAEKEAEILKEVRKLVEKVLGDDLHQEHDSDTEMRFG